MTSISMTPQKRNVRKYPDHINPDRLPKHTGYDPRGCGRWYYRRRVAGIRGKEIRLGDSTMTMAAIWSAVERIESGKQDTFRGLSLEFQRSDSWRELAPSTQIDYAKCHKAICERQNRAGYTLGDIPLDAWTVGNVRKYRDARKRESPSRSSKEIAYMKRLFTWGVEYEYCASNPAKEVTLGGMTRPRTHYPQDADYYAALNVAPLSIALMAHLAYLTGRRRTDIIKLKRSDLEPDGIFFHESKTDKASLVMWTDELADLVDLIKEEAGLSMWLFPASTWKGDHYRLAALSTAWQRVRERLVEIGCVPFQFKDIRAKHASDLDESGADATENLQHSSRGLTKRHYLRKPKKVVSLR